MCACIYVTAPTFIIHLFDNSKCNGTNFNHKMELYGTTNLVIMNLNVNCNY